ncbi:alanyl-tRNA editing protein [Paenibacillus aestuarii]|uniref:DHHA1 domain-containing protein n=1 Tax=Paenibacillus aestuarii TaxID=516965 RepID=A0ABW0KJ96_9BACL|nr:DHHA1 domain-containing protein [Paenibacillus aestuarii]
MTKKLYYESAYTTEWQTRITKSLEREDGYYVILEETAFYPTGGGQPFDTGEINGIPVLDVMAEEDEVLHKVERLPQEQQVSCRIDWTRRFDHMQQHSGQHLLSAVCRDLYDAMTVSFHMGSDHASIDVERPELSHEQLTAIEREVNRRIYQNLSVVSYFVTPEQMAQLTLVKPPKVTEDIRIVEIKGVEYNACGGTHVSSTGEIGIIKLLKAEKQKGNTRIYFLCGYRALNEFNDNQRILGALSNKFKTAKEDIMERIEKWEQEQRQLQQEIDELKAKNDAYVAQELLASREGTWVAHVFADKPLKDLQNLAAKLATDSDLPVLLATSSENKVVLANSGRVELSCGAFFKAHLSEFQGKGGGSDKSAQAGFPSWEDALAFFEYTKRHLAEKA